MGVGLTTAEVKEINGAIEQYMNGVITLAEVLELATQRVALEIKGRAKEWRSSSDGRKMVDLYLRLHGALMDAYSLQKLSWTSDIGQLSDHGICTHCLSQLVSKSTGLVAIDEAIDG
jgi:hypothetical protein